MPRLSVVLMTERSFLTYRYPNDQRVRVSTGILIRDSRILLVQRLPHKESGWMWECPGGKVEPGESLVQALWRELDEEIGLRFDDRTQRPGLDLVFRNDFDPPVVHVACALYYYRLDHVPDDFEPECNEGVGLGWFTRDEAVKLTLAPGNRNLHTLWKLR